jgi:putative DNA primase/helicase
LFICHGDGANGKTTLLETILWLLGDYACKASADTFLSRKNDGGPSENLAVLRGARFAPAVEPDAGRALAESVLKEATGGDTMRVRRLYERSWQFTPTFKLWLACNRLPRVRGTDHGIWRRLVTVPFMVKIPEAQRDRDLLGKLKSEASGILNWCLDGLADYGQRGLAPPEAVVKDREAYRSNEDQLAGWLAECCVTVETARCPTKDLRQSYETWCGEAGEAPLGSKAWRDELRRRGFQTVKMHGYPTYSGVGLVAQDASPPSRSGT